MNNEASPGSPNLKEINRRLDRLEQSDKLSIKANEIEYSFPDFGASENTEYEDSDYKKYRDRTLDDTKRLIELLEQKQEESLQEIRVLTDQTREMTYIEEGENFRIRMWQQYLQRELDTSSTTSHDELELFAGLSESDFLETLSDAGLCSEDPPGVLKDIVDAGNRNWIPKLRIEAKFHEKVFKASFHPQGAYLITAAGNEFCVLDFETFNELQILQEITHQKCSHSINCIQSHPETDVFITGGSDASVIVWDLPQVATVKKLWVESEVQSCVFSSDGLLAIGGKSGVVTMFDSSNKDPSKWEQTEQFQAHQASVLSCCFSTEHFVTGSSDHTLRVWSHDSEERTLIHILEGHTHFVNIVTFHPFEPFLISGSWDSNIIVWSQESFEHVTTLKEHETRLETCIFHPSRNLLFSCSIDQKVLCWNFNNFESFEVLLTGQFSSFDPGVSEVLVTSGTEGTLRLYS